MTGGSADRAARYRLHISVVVLLLWLVVTVFAGSRQGNGAADVVDIVSGGIAPQFLAATIFLALALLVFRWNDLGLRRPAPPASVFLAWLPAFWIVVFLGVAVSVGLPPLPAVVFIFVNTLLVGISEELMFRGILFRGLRSRLRLWPAIWVTTGVFGAVHVLNALGTGRPLDAAVQAVTACMSGLLFMALLLRTRSILVPMAVHGLWDGALLLMNLAILRWAGATEVPAEPTNPLLLLVPVVFVLPNLIYGLFLLRHASRDQDNQTSYQ